MSDNNYMVPSAGHVSWNELVTQNTPAAADFYGKLFGWQASPFKPQGAPENAPDYTIFHTDRTDVMGVGGMVQAMDPCVPPMWVPYVVVKQLEESLAKAEQLGAKVLVPPMSVGEVGRIAVLRDPQGATFGLHELGG